MTTGYIRLEGAASHNLRDVTVELPRGRLTVVTGVSGSGKSSLVFDTLHAAAERRYLETLSAHARRFLQRMPAPPLAAARGLSPSIALGQRRAGDHARSTVGTRSGLMDLLRVWFARANDLEPRELSFVSAGACPECRGIGSVDEVARDLLVKDDTLTLRQGALVPTTPTGYIVYSQVTVDALDTVCRAHGFDVDTPWRELSREQQDVVFFGSDRVEVPFGKHPLASRMKWQGITARPRELGHYRGIIPTIADILRRSRNENALRFARSVPCPACRGTRLAERARTATLDGTPFPDLLSWPLPRLRAFCAERAGEPAARLVRRLEMFERLGLRHLDCARATGSLSGGEHQRLRLGALATEGLAGVTFVFDEPSIGLHAGEEEQVLDVLRDLRDAGNTVVVVEHSEAALRSADHLIDIGPGAGAAGGRLLFAGPPARLGSQAPAGSPTRQHYADGGEWRGRPLRTRRDLTGATWIELDGAAARNLVDLDVRFATARLNVVCGVAGAGKSTLVGEVLVPALRGESLAGRARAVRGGDAVGQVVHVDQSPIGRTPRSNAATYTGAFDEIRKLFAKVPLAVERGFRATTFSCNTKNGGRCPACEGSGREVVGMHGLPPVELTCAQCGGRRFVADVLAVRYADRWSITDVLEASVDEARVMFADALPVRAVLDALHAVGLGYLPLGQPATTLSGGEAQRVRLAGELARGGRKATLFVLEEPTIGLHREDVRGLLTALDGLIEKGHTVVLVEHDLDVLRAADHLIELGPGAGPDGGRLLGQGDADSIVQLDTPTARALRSAPTASRREPAPPLPRMQLRGVATHNLRDVDIDLPAAGLTVVTGVSGSGKSSLVFDTLFGESRARLTEHLSGHVQRQLGVSGARTRTLRTADGLRPAIALRQRTEADATADRRATVATTGFVHPLLRTMWSRGSGDRLPAAAFSFFRREGACPTCRGLGSVRRVDPGRLIADPSRPLFDGALAANKVVRAYADPGMRHRATLQAVARAKGIELDRPFAALPAAAQAAILTGCGEQTFEVEWRHDGAEGDGPHRFRAPWPGIAGDIDLEYARRVASGSKARREQFEQLLEDRPCPACHGTRLAEPGRSARLFGETLPAFCARSVAAILARLDRGVDLEERTRTIVAGPLAEVAARLRRLQQLGLGHLTLDRSTASLSAGERQRLRLAAQLAAPLTDCAYVLDEPTLGLHPSDTDQLLAAIAGLIAAGNTVVAVEHDHRVVAAADHVIEVGPGAGALGGRIVASGPPAELPPDCRTARVLASTPTPPRTAPRRQATEALTVHGARRHHLHDLTVAFPIGCMTAVTGVSGSGKTSLLRGVVATSARDGTARGCRAIEGLDRFSAVIDDGAARRSRSRTACVATLLGCYGPLQKQLAATEPARANGWRAAHFALQGRSGGACRTCHGVGEVRDELDFLGAGAWHTCEDCGGTRFDAATRTVAWLGLSLGELFATPLEQLRERLPARGLSALRRPLDMAIRLGLGYLPLGQNAEALSGGEAQRLALAAHLAQPHPERTLFVLDEPSRGLHPDDVTALLAALEALTAAGHTVLMIEHDLDLIAAADHVVDLGPGAGPAGGRIVFQGPPAALAAYEASRTGQALAARVRCAGS